MGGIALAHNNERAASPLPDPLPATLDPAPCALAPAGMTGFWVLCFMWLKFATIWRFFRCAGSLLAS